MDGASGRTGMTPTRQQQVAILLGASVMLSLGMGMRQSFGLFVLPVTRELGFSVADFTFAMALQNIIWGVAQPFVGAYADRYGSRPVMMFGASLYVLGHGDDGLRPGSAQLHDRRRRAYRHLAGVLRLQPRHDGLRPRGVAGLAQHGARHHLVGGLDRHVLLRAAGTNAYREPRLADHLHRFHRARARDAAGGVFHWRRRQGPSAGGARRGRVPMRTVLREAVRHRGFITMSAAFFVCGMQLIFITTHLPTYLSLCGQDPMLGAKALATIGMFNVAGCYLIRLARRTLSEARAAGPHLHSALDHDHHLLHGAGVADLDPGLRSGDGRAVARRRAA